MPAPVVMPDPTRLLVQKAITTALEQIRPANGYHHDLLGKVFRGRIVFGKNDPKTMVSILEVPIPLEQIRGPADNKASTGPWELIIQGFVPDDKLNPTDPAHKLMAEVKKRLVLEKKKLRKEMTAFGLGNVITGIDIGPGTVRPPDDVSANAYFWLSLTLTIVEDLEDPYWTGDS